MNNKLIAYIYNDEGRYSYQVWFDNTIDNIANFLYQVKNAPKVEITNTDDRIVILFLNDGNFNLQYNDQHKGLAETFEALCQSNDTKKITDLEISHGEYETPYLKTYLNTIFGVEIL